jgi:hypothetical protein
VLSAYGDCVTFHKNSLPAWTSFNITSTAYGVRSVYGADMDGTGTVDVVVACFSGILWLQNRGGSPLVWAEYSIALTAVEPVAVVAADVSCRKEPSRRTSAYLTIVYVEPF